MDSAAMLTRSLTLKTLTSPFQTRQTPNRLNHAPPTLKPPSTKTTKSHSSPTSHSRISTRMPLPSSNSSHKAPVPMLVKKWRTTRTGCQFSKTINSWGTATSKTMLRIGISLESNWWVANLSVNEFLMFLQFNSRFERRNLKYLRIYLKQPSPQWLDYTLRMCTFYTKRTDYSTSTSGILNSPSSRVGSSHGSSANGASAFDAFKGKLSQC